MTDKHTDETQRDEHAVIGGVAGKKVFVMDNAANVITQFGTATISLMPYTFYQNVSLVSGYNFYGMAAPGSNPTTATFRLQRETLLTGELLFGSGHAQFTHQWSAASMASISWS